MGRAVTPVLIGTLPFNFNEQYLPWPFGSIMLCGLCDSLYLLPLFDEVFSSIILLLIIELAIPLLLCPSLFNFSIFDVSIDLVVND